MSGQGGNEQGGHHAGGARCHCLVITHTPERIARTLMGVGAQSLAPVSITVAADGDDPRIGDEVARAAERIGRSITLVTRARGEVSCRSQNRNNAVRALGSMADPNDALVFFDGDCIPDTGALASHVRTLGRADVSLGWAVRLSESQTAHLTDEHACEGRVGGLLDDEQRRSGEEVDRRTRKRIMLRRFGMTKPHKPGILSGNFAVRLATFRRVNGFDESFTGWGAEDDDLARRLYASGAKPGSSMRSAIVYHQHHPSEAPADWSAGQNAGRLEQRATTYAALGLDNPAPQETPRVRVIEGDAVMTGTR